MAQTLESLRSTASQLGIFLPLTEETDALSAPLTLHGHELKNRASVMVSAAYDADENGAPTKDTIARYVKAAQSRPCGMLWSEPIAVSAEARTNNRQLVFSDANTDAFAALLKAVRDAVGKDIVLVALLDHAGRKALSPVAFEACPLFEKRPEILAETAVTPIAAACGMAAKTAVSAGFDGIALNVCERNLFAESLAAYHRNGSFGGDFDDRSRFVRDCFTAIKLMCGNAFLTLRLCLSDGLPQPYGFGMAFEDESAPELSESVLLIQILQALFGVQMVACEVGISEKTWLCSEKEEDAILPAGRLCTCTAMLDSALQQNVTLLLPQSAVHEDIPFDHLAAGMISGEFASLAGFTD